MKTKMTIAVMAAISALALAANAQDNTRPPTASRRRSTQALTVVVAADFMCCRRR